VLLYLHPQVEQAFQDLNILFCELCSLLLLSPSASVPRRGTQPISSAASSASNALITGHVALYIEGLLAAASNNSIGLARPLTTPAYTALLPSIWALLSSVDAPSELLEATMQHALSVSSTSGIKRATIQFVGRLVVLQGERGYAGPLCFPTHSTAGTTSNLASEWIQHLPKTLWELGSRDLGTSEVVLRILLHLAHRRSRFLSREVSTVLCYLYLEPRLTMVVIMYVHLDSNQPPLSPRTLLHHEARHPRESPRSIRQAIARSEEARSRSCADASLVDGQDEHRGRRVCYGGDDGGEWFG
jgi:hypothetical protein